MKLDTSILCLGIALLPSTWAAKYSLPIYMQKVKDHHAAPWHHDAVRSENQKFLSDPPFHDDKEELPLSFSEVYPMLQLNGYQYTTPLSLGTPPQPFNAIIDLAWSDLFVPSSTCHGTGCSTFVRTYNSNSSSSYAPNSAEATIHYEPIHASGHLSSDLLILGTSFQIPDLHFVELTHYKLWTHPEVLHLSFYESVLGLAMGENWPPTIFPPSPNRVSSPFAQMLSKNLLDKNVFSLLLPSDPSTPGELTFGGTNPAIVSSELVSHPLFPGNKTNWQIRVEALYVLPQDGNPAFALTPPASSPHAREWTAHLVTRTPFIGLPASMVQMLRSHLPPLQFSECNAVAVLPCHLRDTLPYLVIALGECGRQNITLKGEDYAMRRVDVDDMCAGQWEDECVVVVGELPGIVSDWVADEMMVLGSAVLRKVVGVFDWEERSVSFGIL